MTPEDAFNDWCKIDHRGYQSSLNPEMIWIAAWKQAQQDAYEECAKLCEEEVPTGYDYPDGDDYAHAIRALKDKS